MVFKFSSSMFYLFFKNQACPHPNKQVEYTCMENLSRQEKFCDYSTISRFLEEMSQSSDPSEAQNKPTRLHEMSLKWPLIPHLLLWADPRRSWDNRTKTLTCKIVAKTNHKFRPDKTKINWRTEKLIKGSQPLKFIRCAINILTIVNP